MEFFFCLFVWVFLFVCFVFCFSLSSLSVLKKLLQHMDIAILKTKKCIKIPEVHYHQQYLFWWWFAIHLIYIEFAFIYLPSMSERFWCTLSSKHETIASIFWFDNWLELNVEIMHLCTREKTLIHTFSRRLHILGGRSLAIFNIRIAIKLTDK